MASRILGMGDVLSLIEKAQTAFDEKSAADLEKKMRTQTFTLDDFLAQMQQLKKMGPLQDLLGMIPGVDAKALKGMDFDEKQYGRTMAIIQSMTARERVKPDIINASRRIRISKGSGTTVQDVNRLLKQFEDMKKMMKQFSGPMGKKLMKGMGNRMGGKMPF